MRAERHVHAQNQHKTQYKGDELPKVGGEQVGHEVLHDRHVIVDAPHEIAGRFFLHRGHGQHLDFLKQQCPQEAREAVTRNGGNAALHHAQHLVENVKADDGTHDQPQVERP